MLCIGSQSFIVFILFYTRKLALCLKGGEFVLKEISSIPKKS